MSELNYNRLSLVHQLGDEIVLGMDIFDQDDIWQIICCCKVEELSALAEEVRAYVKERYPSDACSESFLEEQLDRWVHQYKWRYYTRILVPRDKITPEMVEEFKERWNIALDLGAPDGDHTEIKVVKCHEEAR